MGLMDIFSNPDTFNSLSMGDKLVGSTITMLMGMGITFCVLLLLWAFVAVMGKAMNVGKAKGDKASEAAKTEAAATPSVAAAPASSAQDDVIAAVIAAAIAAYQSGGGTGNLVVRKISRISGETTAWANAAREDCIESRKF